MFFKKSILLFNISKSVHKSTSEYLRRNMQKMSDGLKTIEENKLFFCNVLDKILYSIRKYFEMWDVPPHSITRQSKNGLEKGMVCVHDLEVGVCKRPQK